MPLLYCEPTSLPYTYIHTCIHTYIHMYVCIWSIYVHNTHAHAKSTWPQDSVQNIRMPLLHWLVGDLIVCVCVCVCAISGTEFFFLISLDCTWRFSCVGSWISNKTSTSSLYETTVGSYLAFYALSRGSIVYEPTVGSYLSFYVSVEAVSVCDFMLNEAIG